VGVGDVGAVSRGCRGQGEPSGGGDGGRADGKRERHVLGGRGRRN